MTTTPSTASEELLTEADYSRPTLECDVVMKGGITSGVVYPLAVCELAKTYRFRCIGGTSAGAIAAAAAAAAEYGRARGAAGSNAGFAGLETLPDWLGDSRRGHSNLFALFQPQKETRRIFHVAVSALGDARWRKTRVLWQLLRRFPLGVLLGLAAGGGVGWIASQAQPRLAAIALYGLAAVLLVVVMLGWAVWRLLAHVRGRVPANGFGLCSGNGPDVNHPKGRPPALTPWLANLLNVLAGKSRPEGPLTFGDLWGPKKKNAQGELEALGFLQGEPLLAERAPKPRPELRIRPRL
jgi:Patatin-like phospholipase